MSQIADTFNEILTVLQELLYLAQGLVVVIFFNLLINIATAKNTQPKKVDKPKRPGILSRIRQRIRPKKQLPKGDRKEGVEK